MIQQAKTSKQKRVELRSKIDSGKILQFPGAFNALVGMMIEQSGFDGVYMSGAVISNSLGLPDIGLTTLTEVLQFSKPICARVTIPSIVDVDTGFGETMNVARTIREIEEIGASGCHLEDQVNPKRCGHLDNKAIVSVEEMVKKIKAAADAKIDPNFILIARTDAATVEGIESAIDRAKAYTDAGADMIFPEAMRDEKDFERFRKEIDLPLLANMTEFGKSKLLSKSTLQELGFNIVIYPVSMQRLAMKSVELGLKTIMDEGTQGNLLPEMQDRKRLYEVLGYEKYNAFDNDIFNFEL
ncbi:methylisocitrate lyase [Reichenbachiella versicolor]|uniref:methylisocitrate lyase n=1 Tax=Reichenbachiella versicolor TaxID=1821036 RepID=UPI000D6EA63C|nr:methylisocitrate lyase [Reichenbachiella versicolor]